MFQDMVSFPLISMLGNVKLPDDSLILCSPSSKNMRIFGINKQYIDDRFLAQISRIIEQVNNGQNPSIKPLLQQLDDNKFTFACTELSMLARLEGIPGHDTLEHTLDKIVRNI